MKKIHIRLSAILLTMVLFSCTPQSISDTDQSKNEVATSGDNGKILPTEDY